ncbi:MAG: ribonuclease E [Dethiosulfovibrio peptidovorans]|nr:MAG: ribonuclease E [Dethiosulfovibrio peptidovorans]
MADCGKDVRIVANTMDPEEMRVAIIQGDRLRELFVERMWERQRSGEIYKAKVESVLPGMNASFVNLGDGRNGFLYLKDAKGLDLKPGNDVLVQVTKSARKNKGARVTTRISIPGRYLVLVPGGKETGVSKRIDDDEARRRLRKMARAFLREEGMGIIVRTAAAGAGLEALESDFEGLVSLWREIERNAQVQSAPCLLYRDLGLTGRVLRDEFNDDVFDIVVDTKDEQIRVEEWLRMYGGPNVPDVSLHRGKTPIFEYYDLEKQVEAILAQKVWLRSGAYLVIEQTEALTVVDVNTGKFVGTSDMRETVLQTNLEAADEIVWQLRLRAIGGIVVVDFIDMELQEDRWTLVRRLEELLARDRCRSRVFGVTHLGLVEITRKRARPDIRFVLTRGCPLCGVSARVLKEDSVAVILKRFLRKVIQSNRSQAFLLECHPEVAQYVEEAYRRGWEDEFGRVIALCAMPSMAWDRCRLDYQGSLDGLEKMIARRQREGFVVYRTTSA